MKRADLYKKRAAWLTANWEYERSYYKDFDYTILDNIMYITRAGRGHKGETYNECIIMADTETSKERAGEICENYIVAWSLSIRAFNQNIATLYGHKPSEFIECVNMIKSRLKGKYTIIYWHNMAYDWVFIRLHCMQEWGIPENQLNVKSHYPIFIYFENGIRFKDSLILAQRGIERWANDLNVEHKKAVGKWDYDKVRLQSDTFSESELDYIECDTLAGVECIQATMDTLNKFIYSIPYTATGIPREDIQKLAKINGGKTWFNKVVPDVSIQLMLELIFHGGYTHANRHYIGQIIDWIEVKCKDYTSDYPFQMLSKKFPMGRFKPVKGAKSVEYILKNSSKYAFIFKLILRAPKLKDDFIAMPVLQFSKCTKIVNPVLDNGRVLCCEYCELYICEQDLKIIYQQYDLSRGAAITDVYYTHKDYLPRWFTDYIYKCFVEKCKLKGKDPVLYSIAKSKVNSCYGMTVQKPVKETINEIYETGEFKTEDDFNFKAEYDKYAKKYTTVLPYQIGVYVTAYALVDLYALGACCKYWWYSDTDSCYGSGWNEKKLTTLNNKQTRLLKKNGYDPVVVDGTTYYLGTADTDGVYKAARFLGAKRYACVTEDDNLKITVAGVPKKSGAKLLKNDIRNFHRGYIFNYSDPEALLDVTDKKKLQHTYFFNGKIWTDDKGNERADSIDLSPTTYVLDDVKEVDWEKIFEEEIKIQVYDVEEETQR